MVSMPGTLRDSVSRSRQTALARRGVSRSSSRVAKRLIEPGEMDDHSGLHGGAWSTAQAVSQRPEPHTMGSAHGPIMCVHPSEKPLRFARCT